MKPCTTHHHACDCRERALLTTLRPLVEEFRKDGSETCICAYVDINELWRELYGCGIEDDKRFE